MTTTPPTPPPPAFELAAGDFNRNKLTVLGFTAEEGISKLFKFHVEVAAPPDVDLSAEKSFVGARASFFIHSGDRARVVHGRVGRVTALDGAIETNRRVYRVLVVPPLWISKRRSGSAVYQNKTVPQIVTVMCVDAQVSSSGDQLISHQECELPLGDAYPPREYCVQYRESDYAFIKRIVAEEGIFWYFRHSPDAYPSTENPIVFIDRASAYPALDPMPTVHISGRSFDSMAASTSVSRFEASHTLRSNSVLLRDYDDAKPLLQVQGAAGFDESEYEAALEPEGELRIYEHRGDYLVPDASDDRAERHLQQHRRRSFEARGESSSRLLMPGYRFQIDAADAPSFSGEYVITKIHHEARLPEYTPGGGREQVYKNVFSCVRSDVAYRPKRPKAKPRQVIESAMVVGPQEGTVHTDDLGRIRVQFLWDMTGRSDETSTTWLRVIQGWAGASYGFQFIPRVGMEVMVSFLGGDPDSPVVVGAIHNGARPYPFRLPDQRTRGGVRTVSTPGGQGFNELSFEDLAGSEQVYLHAQRDLDEDIKRNHTTIVKKSQTTDIGEAQTVRVGGNQEELVEGAASRVVKRDEKLEVKGNRATAVGGSDVLETEFERRVRVGTNERREVAGTLDWKVGDDVTLRTEGCMTTLVGKADAKRSYVLHVEGTAELSSEEITEIVSTEGIRLRCGESILQMTKDHIELIAPKLTLRSPDSRVVVDGDKLQFYAKADAVLKSGDTVLVASAGASLTLKSEFKASGSQILLNAPDVAKDPVREDPPPPTVIELVDDEGKPMPYGRFVLVLGDGSERSFVADENGRAEVPDLEGTAHIVLPGLIESTYG